MNWPGAVICMMPPQLHTVWELSFNAGILPIKTVGAPGAHGMVITGTQGGTAGGTLCGLLGELHIPKGSILTRGLLSAIVAGGFISVSTFLSGVNISVDGIVPKLHVKLAPAHTHIPIGES